MGILSLLFGAVGLLISIAGSCGPGHGQPVASRIVSGILGGVPSLLGMYLAVPMREPSIGALVTGAGMVFALVGYQRLYTAHTAQKTSATRYSIRTIK